MGNQLSKGNDTNTRDEYIKYKTCRECGYKVKTSNPTFGLNVHCHKYKEVLVSVFSMSGYLHSMRCDDCINIKIKEDLFTIHRDNKGEL